MSALVTIDCNSGTLNRYETGGTKARRTHTATPILGIATLTTALIEDFRRNPTADFAVTPPPQPPLPPAARMQTPREALADLIASRKR